MSNKQFEYNEYINVMLAGIVTSIGEDSVKRIIDEYKNDEYDCVSDLLSDLLDRVASVDRYSMRQALVIEAMNYMLEKQKFETDKEE